MVAKRGLGFTRIKSTHQGKVLIVEDEPLIRRALARELRAKGWDVLEASHPAEAVDLYDEADVVLSDWQMPHGGGFRVLQDSPTPVVVMSALLSGEVLIDISKLSLHMDADDVPIPYHIEQKPPDRNRLHKALIEAINSTKEPTNG